MMLAGIIARRRASADDVPTYLYKVPAQPALSRNLSSVEAANGLIYAIDSVSNRGRGSGQIVVVSEDDPDREIRLGAVSGPFPAGFTEGFSASTLLTVDASSSD